MTGESVKDCRWCERCKSYHPARTKCAETVRERADRELRVELLLLAQTILAIIILVLAGVQLVYWFQHPSLTQMELLIEKWPGYATLTLVSLGFAVCEAMKRDT